MKKEDKTKSENTIAMSKFFNLTQQRRLFSLSKFLERKSHGSYVPFDEGSRQQLLVFVATIVKGWWFVPQSTNVALLQTCSTVNVQFT